MLIAFRPRLLVLVVIAAFMWPRAEAVQSALGSGTPPPDSENSSTSTGMMTTLADFDSCVKPGARFFDAAWARALPVAQARPAISSKAPQARASGARDAAERNIDMNPP